MKIEKLNLFFASSSLAADAGLYGQAKLKGEEICKNLSDIARVVRFWNVYGFEFPGIKSHIITDFVYQCVTKKRAIGRTDGTELRQFTHTDDISRALVDVMERFDECDLFLDLTDGKWISLQTVADVIMKVIPDCKISFSDVPPKFQKRHEPKNNTFFHQRIWRPTLSLKQGINKVRKDTIKYHKTSGDIDLSILIKPRLCSFDIINHLNNISQLLNPFNVQIIRLEYYEKKEFLRKFQQVKGNNVMIIFDDIFPDISHLEVFKKRQTEKFYVYTADINTTGSHPLSKQNYFTITIFNKTSHMQDAFKFSEFIAAKTKMFQGLFNPFDVGSMHEQILSLGEGYIGVLMGKPALVKNP